MLFISDALIPCPTWSGLAQRFDLLCLAIAAEYILNDMPFLLAAVILMLALLVLCWLNREVQFHRAETQAHGTLATPA